MAAMRVAFVTFGCRLNRAEALDTEASYAAAGHEVVPLDAPDPAPDLIILRGCSVTAKAQHDCEKKIAHLKVRFPNARLMITGCLPEAMRTLEPMDAIGQGASTYASPVPLATSRAYLKVQDGCSGRCAFCIVPQFRGPPRSMPFEDVLARARAFLAAGFRELVVTGCNLALYRSAGRGLPDLLSALASLSAETPHRVRLGSLEPGLCDAALIEVMARHANICRFLHISLQSAAPHVLARMKRPYTLESVAALCTAARRRLGPRLMLGADVICGFPGESEDDFTHTRAFLAGEHPDAPGIRFANLHVFPYSERPGTPAATMPDALPMATRRARAQTLEHLGQAQREAFARSFTGQSVQVCVERGNDHGWTAEYLPCRLAAPAPRRTLIDVRIRDSQRDTLFAL